MLICFYGNAQRPKVGLTLSGGGAKGMAHIGVLQALDSAGLKVDYITGTSMGSIVGAMYATGYSANQIDSISKQLDWNTLLSGKPKFTDIGIDEKDEFGRYSVEIPMDGIKPNLGTGLIESEEVWLQFSEIFFHVYDQKDFTQFDIPFKCIATDLSTGEAKVLSSGELVKALRSSMSLPSVFEAVEYDSTHYVDGGIVRNFPVSDVVEMGADFVIGVNLFPGLESSQDLNSAMSVMYQITNYRDAYDLEKEKKICDILIEPPLSGYSAGSFDAVDEILDVGYEMREKYYPYFKHLADSLNDLAKVDFDPNSRLKNKQTVVIDVAEIIGLNTINKEVLLKKVNLKKHKAYKANEITDAFRSMYSTLYFKYIYYELIPTTPGHAKMIVRVKENSKGALKLGFSYHSWTSPAILLNYTGRNLLFDKSRSMIKLAISEDFKGLLEHRQFFGNSLSNSLTFYLKHIQQKVNSYDGSEIRTQYKTYNTAVGIRYNYYLSKKSSLGLGIEYGNSNFSPEIVSTFRFEGYSRGFNTEVSYQINTTNRPFLPTKGIEVEFSGNMLFNRSYSANYVGADTISNQDSVYYIKPQDPLFKLAMHLNWYMPTGSKTTLLYNVQVGKIFSDTNYYLDNILAGGCEKIYKTQFPFYGYQDAQLPATSMASVLFGVQYNLFSELYVLGRANVGFYNFYTSNEFIDDKTTTFISGFNLAIAYNLSLLPMELSLNYSPEVDAVFGHIRLGFIF